MVGRGHWASKYLRQNHGNPRAHAHSILCTRSPTEMPLPKVGTGGTKSFSLEDSLSTFPRFISNYFPAWLHKKM